MERNDRSPRLAATHRYKQVPYCDQQVVAITFVQRALYLSDSDSET
jgi:hypothetical protein